MQGFFKFECSMFWYNRLTLYFETYCRPQVSTLSCKVSFNVQELVNTKCYLGCFIKQRVFDSKAIKSL